MRMTRVRDVMASLFVLCLFLAFIAGILLALGKPVPFIGKFLGQ